MKFMAYSFNLNGRNKTSWALNFSIKKYLLSVIIFYLSVSAFSAADEWRGWRGLDKQACSDSTGPLVWSSTSNIRWKVHLDGEGFSSPVVSETDVFVTAAHAEDISQKINSVIFLLLVSLAILLILRNLYLLIQNILRNGMSAKDSLVFRLSLLIIFGFFIFGYSIICWMYFNESRREAERMLINYMFSGALLLFSILLSALKLPERSKFRFLTGVLVIVLVALLIRFRPHREFFLLSDFIQVKYIWLFELTIISVVLPVILSFHLIINVFTHNQTTRKVINNPILSYTEKLSSNSPRFSFFTAVLLGLSGFISIPLIAAFKWFLRNDLARIQDQWSLSLFLDPGFAYPFFPGILSLGYLIWFFVENKKGGFDSDKRSRLFPVLIGFSAIFFILLNYGRQDTSVIRDTLCIDRHSGIIKWQRHDLTGPAVECSNYNSQASPTPLIDSNSVYAYFGSAGLISADKSGNFRWMNNSLPFKSIHGAGASPVFWKGGIVILSSMSENPYLISLDKKTGKEQWKTDLPEISGVGGEYRTPIIFEYDGQELILEWSTSRSEIVIYEAKTGRIINNFITDWAERDEAITTPCLHDGILYLSDNKSVVASDIRKLLNNDSSILWKTELSGRGPTTSSPVFSNGLLFMISDNGFANCLNARTGDILWQKKLKGLYFSSPVSIGKNIFFSNSAGITTILKSAPEYTLIAENALPEGIYSTLVPVDGELFIRTKNTLWCIK
jgi:outer membrane protein assembly factor BamB